MKVLLVRSGALGDVLLLRRAVAALRRAGHVPTLLAPRAAGGALVGRGGSEVVALLALDGADAAALFRDGPLEASLAGALAGFDVALVYSNDAALRGHVTAAVGRVIACDPKPAARVHASDWLARPLAELGLDTPDPPPLEPTGPERAAAEPILARLPGWFIAVHPGSGSPAKSWPLDRFEALIEALAPPTWLLVEGPAERDLPASPLAARPGAVVARELPPRALGALLARASLFVGNDSGVSHLAAAYGAPTLALFGPTDPDVWSPVGPRVRTLRAATGAMDGLPAELVVAAALGMAAART
jgi:ADP-heptose:LPS heptosyltransferase